MIDTKLCEVQGLLHTLLGRDIFEGAIHVACYSVRTANGIPTNVSAITTPSGV